MNEHDLLDTLITDEPPPRFTPDALIGRSRRRLRRRRVATVGAGALAVAAILGGTAALWPTGTGAVRTGGASTTGSVAASGPSASAAAESRQEATDRVVAAMRAAVLAAAPAAVLGPAAVQASRSGDQAGYDVDEKQTIIVDGQKGVAYVSLAWKSLSQRNLACPKPAAGVVIHTCTTTGAGNVRVLSLDEVLTGTDLRLRSVTVLRADGTQVFAAALNEDRVLAWDGSEDALGPVEHLNSDPPLTLAELTQIAETPTLP